jgi:hypothetical protein
MVQRRMGLSSLKPTGAQDSNGTRGTLKSGNAAEVTEKFLLEQWDFEIAHRFAIDLPGSGSAQTETCYGKQ